MRIRRSSSALACAALVCALAAASCLGDSGVADGSEPTEAAGAGEGSTVPGTAAHAVDEHAPAPAEEGGDAEGSGADTRYVSLWIGLYCSATEDGAARSFSFYIDGHPVQSVETPCAGEPEPGVEPPNGGQFRIPVEPGVRVLRVQDDTEDYHTEHDIAVPDDHWVFVHHRTLPGGTGHLTSVTSRYERPRFAY